MIRRLNKLFAIILAVFLIGLSTAYTKQNKENFSAVKANEVFDQITLKLATQNLNVANFENAIEMLSNLNNEAKLCYQENIEKLDSIEKQLKAFDKTSEVANQKDYNYLIERKKNIARIASECHLFEIRSTEVLALYIETLHELTASNLMIKEESLWNIGAYAVDIKKYFELKFFSNTIKNYWYLFVCFLIGYLIYWISVKWMLSWPKKNQQHSQPSDLERFKHKLYHRLNLFGIISLSGVMIYYLFSLSHAPIMLVNLVFLIYIIIGSLSLLWISLLVKSIFKSIKLYTVSVICFSFIALLIIGLALNGYYNLSIYLLLNIFLSVFGLVVALFVNQLLINFISQLDYNNKIWSKKLRYYLGIKAHKKIPEVTILKIVATVLVTIVFLTVLVHLWGFKTRYPDQFIIGLLEGFILFQVTIELPKIILALLSFVLLCFLGRLLSAKISRQHQHKDESLQVALASITGYVIFSLATLLALLISGVNFTGLAIIAGALSVGIGLGLQDIVNNFVSGIVLLIEKPIQPGDRVIVGDTEGIVKKVRIRSTQITTLAKSDVIVPNADLIKNQVTNYMFRDQFWRISCAVGVAYGSDIDLVKSVLLEVSANHPDVINTGPDAPVVLFREFGESSLNFELWCIIRDVNDKFKVQSDLHFEIDHAFRKNKITIAFPQRDVHLYKHE
ncbi:mechanosensitive ion channel [Thiotrichales bacterium 19S11-10]|nr:mechanosensitive ion channel [Thiotrichales bacterium 19S11-10]